MGRSVAGRGHRFGHSGPYRSSFAAPTPLSRRGPSIVVGVAVAMARSSSETVISVELNPWVEGRFGGGLRGVPGAVRALRLERDKGPTEITHGHGTSPLTSHEAILENRSRHAQPVSDLRHASSLEPRRGRTVGGVYYDAIGLFVYSAEVVELKVGERRVARAALLGRFPSTRMATS